MRFQKAIKRMIALGTGAIMVGSSVFGAVDLANFPAPFIKDGKFTGVLIVGDRAAAEDVIGISDVVSSLQFAATKKVTSGGSTDVTFSGDAWQAGTSTKILELTQRDNSGSRESIATITTSSFIDNAELPGLLAKGSTSNNKGTAEYDQRLYFEDTTTGYVLYTENANSVTGDFLYFPNGKQIARYELEFTTQLESDVDDSAGSASTTGTFLTDIEDVELNMLGKKFEIVTARRITAAGNDVKLTLMGGTTKDTLLEKQTKTYTVGGKNYEVTLSFVDADEAQLIVNGQTTRKLKDGDTDKLSDGTTIGVTDVLYQDYADGIHSATFFIGAQKVELRDTNIKDTASSDELKVDDETIDDAHVFVEGTDDNTSFKIDKIKVNISADDDFYVPAGGKLSEEMIAEGSEPEALFTKNWDIEYKGLSKQTTSEIKVKASGSDDYQLEFVDGRGNKVSLPLLNVPGSSTMKFGDDNDDLIIQENKTIRKDSYFIVTDESDTDGERQSFALRYRGADKDGSETPILKFDDLGSGERLERPISKSGTTAATAMRVGEIKLGGGTFRVYNVTSTLSDDFNIVVDLDGTGSDTAVEDSALGGSRVALNTKDGARIDIINQSDTSVIINVSTPNTDDFDDIAPGPIIFNLSATAGEVRAAKHTDNNLSYKSPDDDDDNEYAYTSMGAFVKFYSPSSDPNEVTVTYPTEQRVPLVYITGKDVSFSETGVTSTEAVTVQRIEVGAAKLASEVSNVMAQNTILVGGPCANAAAATVMGNPADCTEGFTPGEGIIQVWEHANGNVAMLVAGYGAVDTRNAAGVVANYKDYAGKLKGTKVTVKKVNNQLTVATATA